MSLNAPEKIISNPQKELNVFKDTLEKNSLSNFGNTFDKVPERNREELVIKTVTEHNEKTAHLMTPEYSEKKEEAEKITKVLVEKRLAACVQIVGPIESTYWWNANR